MFVAAAWIGASWPAVLAAPKLQIAFPSEPYAVPSTSTESGWIKFTILTGDPSTVYFQDSRSYPFHYDFAVAELAPFQGMTPAQFDQVTLYQQGQQAILGAVILPPLVGGGPPWEYGIQFVGRDPYPPALVRDLFHTVRSRVLADPEALALYFPSFEQLAAAEQNEAYFAAEGITISSTERWASGNSCYSFGWALGRLVYVAPEQIDAAWLSGALGPDDVLLTDGIPAEIPSVAGVISLAPATPNSHVVILAQTFRTPFAYLALDADRQEAESLVGRQILFRVDDHIHGCRLRLVDVEGQIDATTLHQIRALKQPGPLAIVPMQPYGSYSQNVLNLSAWAVGYFGGKAANFGTIRRAIPANSPVATAFSFDLWNGFLDQVLSNGRTLRAEIALRLAPFAWPPDMSDLATALDGIRALIRDTDETVFPPTLQSGVITTLQDPQYGFDPLRNLRFRSSTNVEDAEQFTGAGLYDSFSGCLADDVDVDGSGPSLCDATESSERGVFRAIRRVYASFYNLNAYLERLRYGVNEAQVGMALLVHHSFPDEIELANGVALYEKTGNWRTVEMVTQAGASSVTNPEPGAVPEEVRVPSWTANPAVIQHSNLVQLGATVMTFPDDYTDLTNLLTLVAERYAFESGLTDFVLDLEYKKLAPDGLLSVDQVRRVPQADDTPSITPFLVNAPGEYCVLQGEGSNAFAYQRLKSRFTLSTRNTWLTSESLTQGLFADATLAYSESCQDYEQTGPLPEWPAAMHGSGADYTTDGWSFTNLQNPRTYALTTQYIPLLVAPSQSPVLVLADLGAVFSHDRFNGCLGLGVAHAQPVPAVSPGGGAPFLTTNDFAWLCRCPGPRTVEVLRERRLATGGVSIVTRYYWAKALAAGGLTFSTTRFLDTAITGLTSTPITLTAERAQTYAPSHHNANEQFLFEPGRDPGLTSGQRAELESLGIRGLLMSCGSTGCAYSTFDDAAWGGACLACTGFDGDRDGYCTGEPHYDCNDADPLVGERPGEVPDLVFLDPTSLAWGIPDGPGSPAPLFDVLRSTSRSDFVAAATCVESDGSDLGAVDTDEPGPGGVFFYQVRAQDNCDGSLGQRSDGTDRVGLSCP